MPLILCCGELPVQFLLLFVLGINLSLYFLVDLIDDEDALQISIRRKVLFHKVTIINQNIIVIAGSSVRPCQTFILVDSISD